MFLFHLYLKKTPEQLPKVTHQTGCRASSSCSGQHACPLVPSSLRWTSNRTTNRCQRHRLPCLGATLKHAFSDSSQSGSVLAISPFCTKNGSLQTQALQYGWAHLLIEMSTWWLRGRQHRPPWTKRLSSQTGLLRKTAPCFIFAFCCFVDHSC